MIDHAVSEATENLTVEYAFFKTFKEKLHQNKSCTLTIL